MLRPPCWIWVSLCFALSSFGCARTAPERARFGRYAVYEPRGATELSTGLRAEVLLTPERTGLAQAGLALLEVDAAQVVPLHRHEGAEILFLLAGAGELRTRGPISLNAREGIWLPGGTAHAFRATARSQVLALYVPAGPELRYLGLTDPGTVLVDAAAAAAATQPDAVKFTPSTSPAIRIAGGTGVVRLGLEATQSPAPPVSCSLLELAPGGAVAAHRHADSAEILYIFEGAALLKVEGREERIQVPAAVMIAPGVEHEVTVTSAVPLRAVQWYTPAGPEQRFKPR